MPSRLIRQASAKHNSLAKLPAPHEDLTDDPYSNNAFIVMKDKFDMSDTLKQSKEYLPKDASESIMQIPKRLVDLHSHN